jgi:UrcA family protein
MITMRHYTIKRTVIPYLLFLATAMGAAAASAAECEIADGVRRCHVHYADLDLSRSPDAAALYSRIRSAAREVCEPVVASTRLESATRARQCVAQSIDRAVADVNAPALTSFHLAKTAQSIKVARQ